MFGSVLPQDGVWGEGPIAEEVVTYWATRRGFIIHVGTRSNYRMLDVRA